MQLVTAQIIIKWRYSNGGKELFKSSRKYKKII